MSEINDHFASLRDSVLEVSRIFAFSRLLVLLIVVFCSTLAFDAVPAREGINYNPLSLAEGVSIAERLETVLRSADASWYLELASTGYQPGPFTDQEAHNWVFFPLYPLLIRSLTALGVGALTAAILISNVCFFLALFTLHRFAVLLGYSAEKVRLALWSIALFPTTYFFSTPQTEALFLLLTAVSFYLIARDKILGSGVAFALAALTRPTGVLLVPAYTYYLWTRNQLFTRRGIAALLFTVLALAAFGAYLHQLTGNPFACIENQSAWGRELLGTTENYSATWLDLDSMMRPWNFVGLNLLVGFLSLATAVYFGWKREFTWCLLVAVPLFAAVSTGTLQSLCRIVMVLFPIHFALASWTRSLEAERMLIAVLAILLGLMSAMYALHVTVAMA